MTIKQVSSRIVSLTLFCCISVLGSLTVANASDIEQGKKVAFDRKKGNCLACHMIAGGELPGNIGPPLRPASRIEMICARKSGIQPPRTPTASCRLLASTGF